MTTITTTRGAELTLTAEDYNVICRRGNIAFGCVQTDNGFASRFPVGGKRIFVELDAPNKAKADAVFAQTARDVKAHANEEAAYEARYQRIVEAQ